MSSQDKKLKVAFLWDWQPNIEQTIQLNDGLQAALRVLEDRGHVVIRFTDSEYPVGDYYPIKEFFDNNYEFDVALFWSDFTRPHIKRCAELEIPMAICFAGGEAITENTPLFDHIFVESKVYKEKLEYAGYDNVSIAFGTNTELFKPEPEQPKLFDTIFPATFALWKRHNLYAQAAQGLRSLACGYIYTDHEQECWQDCQKFGTAILPHVSAETLQKLYAASKVVVVPSMSSGGSQRTVLEAMAMNIPLIVTDSDKYDYVDGTKVWRVDPNIECIRTAIDEILDNNVEVNTRDAVMEHWSEFKYADALEEGLRLACERY